MAIDMITYEFLKKYVEGSAIPNTQPKGVYDSETVYETGSFVTFNNKVYIVPYGSIDENGKGVIQTVKNVTPGTDDQKWQLLISAGEDYASKEDLDKLAGFDTDTIEDLDNKIDTVIEAAEAINNLPGLKIENGGEIFNDYEKKELENGKIDPPNQAISPYSHAEGYNTLVGQKGFQGDFIKEIGRVVITVDKTNSEIFNLISNNKDNLIEKIISAKLVPKVEYDKEKETNYNFMAIGKIGGISISGTVIRIAINENTEYLNNNYAEDWNNFVNARSSKNNDSQFWFHELPELGLTTVDKGTAGHAEGRATTAIGYAHAEGYDTKALGYYSHAEGQSTVALHGAHSEGQGALASGTRSHAEGYYTKATNLTSHAEGYTTRATGEHSHAEGYQNIASGNNSHAEGFLTLSEGENSHTEGNKTYAKGKNAHAEGLGLNATETITEPMYTDLKYSIPKKDINKNYGAIGDYSHSEGNSTHAKAENSHAEGHGTTASGKNSHAEGYNTTASGESSHAEGQSTEASGVRAHAEGQSTHATGDQAHAEGNGTYAEGKYSHAEGAKTWAKGNNSHVEGSSTHANGTNGHAEGYESIANGGTTHAEGHQTIANGYYSHTEGVQTKTGLMDSNNIPITPDKKGMGAHAEGWGTEAIGNNSHAEGYYTKTTRANQHVQGKYNFLSKNTEGNEDAGDYAHIVGWGTSDTNRKNIHTLDTIGNAWFAGDIKVGGSNYNEGEKLLTFDSVVGNYTYQLEDGTSINQDITVRMALEHYIRNYMLPKN